jgi:DNA-binding NarL/FixJ family response regulator
MDKANFLMVENDTLLRQGFVNLLKREYFVRNVYEAGNAVEFEAQLNSHTIDIILLDIHLGEVSGVELLLKLRKMPVQPKVIVVTGLEGIELVINLLKAGVDAIASKLDGYAEVVKAVKVVMKGGTYFPDHVIEVIRNNANRWDNVPPVTLTYREKEFLKALSQGLTTKEISVYLKMAESTAETYRLRLQKKLGVHNTAALLAYAYSNGIL